MLSFQSDNPFPQVGSEISYRQAQEHSAAADIWLGLRVTDVESSLAAEGRKPAGDQELWIGLKPERLLTPYTELREMIERLRPKTGDRIVDLGAAYGRLGFVLVRHAPGVEFLGFEFVEERVREGCRVAALFGLENFRLQTADLAAPEFQLPAAKFYFVYDFGSRRAIDLVLGKLRQISTTRAITVIGRGRASRDAIERREPWLSQVVEPEHFAHYSIYRSAHAIGDVSSVAISPL